MKIQIKASPEEVAHLLRQLAGGTSSLPVQTASPSPSPRSPQEVPARQPAPVAARVDPYDVPVTHGPPVAGPPNVVVPGTPDGAPLGGPSTWGGHHGAREQQTHLVAGVSLPLPADLSRELAPVFAATYSAERRAQSWDTFKTVIAEWLQGWKQTQIVELEGEEPERDESGAIILDGPRSKWAKMKKITYTQEVPVPQPDRVQLLTRLGTGQVPGPLLQLARRVGGLQVLVWQALQEQFLFPDGLSRDEQLLFAQEVAGSMVQIGLQVFPDLRVVMDETSRWERLVA